MVEKSIVETVFSQKEKNLQFDKIVKICKMTIIMEKHAPDQTHSPYIYASITAIKMDM